MRSQYGASSEAFQAIEQDPSNDDYAYYNQNSVRNLPLNQRFWRLLGYHDGNTPESGGSDNKTAITLKPDTEGLISSSSILQTNSYYQYELNFNPADINNLDVGSMDGFIVDKIERDPYYRTWYLVRIPLKEFTRKYGESRVSRIFHICVCGCRDTKNLSHYALQRLNLEVNGIRLII